MCSRRERTRRQGRSVRALGLAGGIALAAAASAPGEARAYGIEVPENGTVAFGRGGAFLVRASDASAVMHNVAGIAALRGFQLHIGSNVGMFTHCYQRAGTINGTADATQTVDGTVFDPSRTEVQSEPRWASGRVPYPEVCNEPRVALAPMILGTYRLNRRFALGFGVFAPSTTGSGQNFPDRESVTFGGSTFEVPSPARNLLFRKNLLVLYPTISIAANITDWLRVGVSAHVGFAQYNFGLMANGSYASPQSPASDTLIDLTARGLLIAGSVGVQAVPLPYLSFGANFRYNAPVNASGTANTTFNYYSATPTAAASMGGQVNGTFDINTMRVQMPWTLRVGARYNHPRPGHPRQNDGSGQYDPMSDDLFDIEAVFNYEHTSLLGTVSLKNTGFIQTDLTPITAPADITINSALRNTMGVRLGGDVNVIPGRLAVRAGVSFETAGVDQLNAQIHLPALGGFSVHAGGSYRWRRVMLNVGFGHFFFIDNEASSGRRAIVARNVTGDGAILQPGTDATSGCTGSQGEGACTINRGTYSASFTSGSVSVSLLF